MTDLPKVREKIIRKSRSSFELYTLLVERQLFESASIPSLIKTTNKRFSSFAPAVCAIEVEDWLVVG